MALWSYTKHPPNMPAAEAGYYIHSNRGWELVRPFPDGPLHIGFQEIIVAINRMDSKHDTSVNNLDQEDGFNFILEDDSHGEDFILME